MKETREELSYGYKSVIYVGYALIGIGIVGIILGIIFMLLAYSIWIPIICWVLGAILLIVGLFWHLTMTPIAYPENTKALEGSFIDFLKDLWNGEGEVLDIGTGQGRTAISIAMNFPKAQVTGVDIWTTMWKVFGQSKEGAERNASIAKVNDRCKFQHASALDLPFEEGEFALVVSSFCFHEISIPDRTELLKEAIRVLAPGGIFLICDMFPGKYYKVGDTPGLLKKVQELGAEDVTHTTFEELGLDMGGLFRIWRFAFLSGRKKNS